MNFAKWQGNQTFLKTVIFKFHSSFITQYSIGSPIDLVKILLSFHSIDVLWPSCMIFILPISFTNHIMLTNIYTPSLLFWEMFIYGL